MFEVCFDEQSVSRLALVWRPEAVAAERVSDTRAANLLFSVLDHKPLVPAKPPRRARKAAKPRKH